MLGDEWQCLGDVPYRKLQVYELEWGGSSSAETSTSSIKDGSGNNNRLEDNHVAAAPNGGPVAMVRDESRLVQAGRKLQPTLRIFSCSGQPMAEVPWGGPAAQSSDRLVGMGWTQAEGLVTVKERGTVSVYDVLGRLCYEMTLVEDNVRKGVDSAFVTHAKVWSDGIAAVMSDREVRILSGLSSALALGQGGGGGEGPPPQLCTIRSSTSGSLLPAADKVTSLAVLEPQHTPSGLPELLLATTDGNVVVAAEDVGGGPGLGARGPLLPEPLPDAVLSMAVAPNGRFLACFLASGLLSVSSTDFATKVVEFDTKTNRTGAAVAAMTSVPPPEQMCWCGEDSVLLYWKGGILMVGPYGDWERFPYASNQPLHLSPEMDCCRILTQSRCEVLQRVPLCTELIKQIGSTSPGALLVDAMEAFQGGDPKADEIIRAMVSRDERGEDEGDGHRHRHRAGDGDGDGEGPTEGAMPASSSGGGEGGRGGGGGRDSRGGDRDRDGDSQLLEAVQACISAAAAELDTTRQKVLLRAAAYGKGFLSDFDSDEFVQCCRKLRVLNTLRGKKVGLPMTVTQFDHLGPERVVDRLVARNEHFLAMQVCSYLGLPSDGVAIHWACQKLRACSEEPSTNNQEQSYGQGGKQKRLSDAELLKLILGRLKPCGKISYAKIAHEATRLGRRHLATLLLDHEPLSSDKVPLLLAMGEGELALTKAVESGDNDLIYLAMLHLQSSVKEGSKESKEGFYRLMYAHPEALALLKAYHYQTDSYADRKALTELCVWRGNYLEAASLTVRHAYRAERVHDRLEGLREAERLLGCNKRDLGFHFTCTRDQIELLEVQKELEKRTKMPVFLDLSLAETLYQVVSIAATQPHAAANPLMGEASALQKRFKVPDKRFWHIKVKALANSGQWAQLQKFAAEKKSPIGYKVFALACIMHHQPKEETERYIDRIPSAEERYELYMECHLWAKALEAALRLKSPRSLVELSRVCDDSAVSAEVNDAIRRMRA